MNPVGIHALVWAGGWSLEEAHRAIASSAKTGYDLIEIPVLDPAAIDVPATRRLLDEYDLGAACSLGLSPETDISSEDPEAVARGEELLTDAVDVARDLGASFLGGGIFSALGRYTRPPTPRGRAHCVRTLTVVVERARAAGITLGLECVNRYESNLVNTAEQALALCDEVNADNLTVHLDTYHMNIEEPNFTTPVQRCAEQGRLGYVHVGESHRGYLGTGTINFDEFFAALRQADYRGPITFESFSSAVVHPDLSRNLAIWRNLWDDGEDLAASARDYIAAHHATG